MGVSFEIYLRRRGNVLMGRHHYVPLRRRHDIPIRRREDVPLRRLVNVPQRRRWVFHLRRPATTSCCRVGQFAYNFFFFKKRIFRKILGAKKTSAKK